MNEILRSNDWMNDRMYEQRDRMLLISQYVYYHVFIVTTYVVKIKSFKRMHNKDKSHSN